MNEIIRNTEKQTVNDYILQRIDGKSVNIASPFFTKNKLLDYIVQNKNKTRLIIKLYEGSDFDLLRNLADKLHIEIRFFSDNAFHMKYYDIEDEVIIGSSNFTKRGLEDNNELNISIKSDTRSIEFLRRNFDENWLVAAKLSLEIIDSCISRKNNIENIKPEFFVSDVLEEVKNSIFLIADIDNTSSRKRLTDEQLKRRNEGSREANSIPVILVDPYKEFSSMTEAAEQEYNYRRGYGEISKVCNEKREHYKKKVWRLKNDYELMSAIQKQELLSFAKDIAKPKEDGRLEEKEYYYYKMMMFRRKVDVAKILYENKLIGKNKNNLADSNREFSSLVNQSKKKNCPFVKIDNEYIYFSNYYVLTVDKSIVDEEPVDNSFECLINKHNRLSNINFGDISYLEILSSTNKIFYKYKGEYYKGFYNIPLNIKKIEKGDAAYFLEEGGVEVMWSTSPGEIKKSTRRYYYLFENVVLSKNENTLKEKIKESFVEELNKDELLLEIDYINI